MSDFHQKDIPVPALAELLTQAVARKASDLHLTVGYPPTLRVAKELQAMQVPPLDARGMEILLGPHINEANREQFFKAGSVNFALTLPNLGRFRVNIYRSKGDIGAAIRVLALPIRPLKELGLPISMAPLLFKSSGMILVTGATGSGKSTTLASMVDHVAKSEKPKKVITIEDPIEYEIGGTHSLVVQREVGTDTPSFNEALIDALRQDPNVLVIGELRDAESIMTSLIAAETGHLVLATLHTPDAPSTITRMISAIPPAQQELARSLLAGSLQAVMAQELLPAADGKSLTLACELLMVTDAVRQMIRQNKPEQLYDVIQTGTNLGMVSKDLSLTMLVKGGKITRETAMPRMRTPQMLGPA